MEAFSPDANDLAARARGDLRLGLAVAVRAGAGLWLAAAAETLEAPRLAALTAGGDAVLAMSRWRAETLKIRIYDGDLARISLAPGTDPQGLAALIDPVTDLAAPLKGPFPALRTGDAAPARAALALCLGARLLPAAVLRPIDAVPPGVTEVKAISAATPDFAWIVSARLPIAASLDTRLHVFRPGDGSEEHYAVEIGHVDRGRPVLARLHSACFTGDVLGSLKCDCGPQLHAALGAMADAGGGVLIYLNQEGRGIGLANKMRAYALQDQGFDTVEANHRLGFEDDERDFAVGARLLAGLTIDRVRLMTNNPRKVAMLSAAGVEVVERVPLWVGETAQNRDYLRVKAERSGHLR